AEHTNVNEALKTRSWEADVTGFPTALLPVAGTQPKTMRYSVDASTTTYNSSSFDVITCLLRNVGTYGKAEPGVGVAELRRDMTTKAQGNEDFSKGYNIPSLIGMGTAAPYFHAGNARTLEAVLSETFAAHNGALTPGFLGNGDPQAAIKRENLIQFLLSIDEDTTPIPVPPVGAEGGDFCSAP
ncbi:MAG: hypothetical protein K0S65_4434, partial [Labilithrix sp.]|nr:hypothetical protein [Labilithrix sp.]